MMARVLILDDEDEVRRLVADVLSSDGHSGDTAYNGPEALSLLDQRRYDLIITDLRLPKLDGPALYEAIRERYRSEEMPRMIFVIGPAKNRDVPAVVRTQRWSWALSAKPHGSSFVSR